MQGILRRTFVILLGLMALALLRAQPADHKSFPLTAYLATLETDFNIKFSYIDADIEGLMVTPPATATLPEILSQLMATVPVAIERINDRYYTLTKRNTITICGRVLDNYATNRIPGATVEVLGTKQALVTDIDGYFYMNDVAPSANLRIRYLGYRTKIIPVAQMQSAKCPNILLAERRQELKEVVVYEILTKGIQRSTDGALTLNPNKLGLLPGLAEPDILFGVQALPGIKSIDETVSDINVRGGTNDQNLILWNGIKMYQSGHFFGLISAFNPYLTEEVKVYKNGTPAQFGDGVSSVILMNTKNDIDDYFFGGAGFNLISGDVFGQIPLNDRWGFQFSGRRSTTDFLDTPAYGSFTQRAFQDTEIRNQNEEMVDQGLRFEEKFFFYDFSGKLLFDFNDDHRFRLSFIGIGNDLDFSETELETAEVSRSFLDQTNLSAGLQWFGNWTSNFSTHLNVYYSKYNLKAQSFFPNQIQRLDQKNIVDERAIKFISKLKASETLEWTNGYQYTETGITNRAFLTQPPFDLNVKGVIRIQAPFSALSYTSENKHLIGTVGLRANYIENLGTFQKWLIEPRLNLNARLAPNLRTQFLAEFKSQSTNQVIDLEQNFLGIEKRRWTLSDAKALPLTQSQQASLGLNYAKNQYYIGFEGFLKKVDGVSTRTQGFQNQDQFNGEIGGYTIRGVEFLVNNKGEQYSTWLSYTYQKGDYQFDSIAPPTFAHNFDIRHSITLAGTYHFKKLKLGMSINYRTGRPFTPLQEEGVLDTSVFPAKIRYGIPNSAQLPAYFRADVSATYPFRIRRDIKGELGVSLLNVTDRNNILNRFYRTNEDNDIESVDHLSLGLTPNLSFRIRF
ncbi:MAG: TonB-dependent receptor [Bacteroidota bacterium]